MSVTEYSATRNRVSLGTILSDVVSARELIWRLCVRDVAATYKQSVLGVIWAIAPPLILVATFTFLARSRVFDIGATALPYPVHVLLGLTVWSVFATTLTNITSCLTRATNLIQKMRFPREALVFSAATQSLIDVAIRGILLIGVAAILGVSFSWTALLIPLFVAPLFLLTIGIGSILAVVNALVRDVNNAVIVLLQFALFLTPVVYPAPTTWPHNIINYVNPVSPFVIAAQDLVTTGTLRMPDAWLAASILGSGMFMIGMYVFRLAEPLVAERL